MAILTILSFILIGGFLILVHRGGHFVVGRAVYGADQPVDPDLAVDRRSVSLRMAIVLAGPAANFLLAMLLFWGILALVGSPGFLPVVGTPEPGSAAALSGLRAGDRILAVMGRPVRTWKDIDAAVRASKGSPLTVRIDRDGDRWEVTLTPRLKVFTDGSGGRRSVLTIGAGPFVSPIVGHVVEGFPADEAGIRVGDRIVAVDGQRIETWEDLTKRIHPRAGRKVRLKVERDGKQLDVTLTPRASARQDVGDRTVTRGLIGVTPDEDSGYHRVAPVAALVEAARWTTARMTVIAQSIWDTVTGVVFGQSTDGPILLAQLTGEQHRQGVVNLILFTALLSINLGMINLLPLPVLDGERLCFLLVELIQGRPVSLGMRRFVQCSVVLLLLAVVISSVWPHVYQFLQTL